MIVKPDYFDKFRCIADRCSDSCCKAWQICFDEETARKYLSEEGEIGGIARRFMRGKAGSRFLALNNGNCPYLQNGLCKVISLKGEDFLCEVCASHPRFTKWFDDVCYYYLSLSCPESARLFVAASNKPVAFAGEGKEELGLLLSEINELFAELLSGRDTISCEEEKRLQSALFACEYIDRTDKEVICSVSREKFENGKKMIKNLPYFVSNLFTYFSLVYYCGSRPYYMPALYSTIAVVSLCADMEVEKALVLFCKEIEHSAKNHKILYRKLFTR